MGGALFGFEISNISNAHTLMCKGDFKDTCGPDAKDSAFWTGLVTSCITVGAFLGTATAGFAQDYFGRKITVVFASVIYILGVIVEFVSPSYGVLVAGRIIVGVGVGWFASTVPMYIAELSPSSIRGRLVTSNQVSAMLARASSRAAAGPPLRLAKPPSLAAKHLHRHPPRLHRQLGLRPERDTVRQRVALHPRDRGHPRGPPLLRIPFCHAQEPALARQAAQVSTPSIDGSGPGTHAVC